MWKNIEDQQPNASTYYTAYGHFLKGQKHERKMRVVAFWDGEKFKDPYGDNLIEVSDSITHWYDMSQIENPY